MYESRGDRTVRVLEREPNSNGKRFCVAPFRDCRTQTEVIRAIRREGLTAATWGEFLSAAKKDGMLRRSLIVGESYECLGGVLGLGRWKSVKLVSGSLEWFDKGLDQVDWHYTDRAVLIDGANRDRRTVRAERAPRKDIPPWKV